MKLNNYRRGFESFLKLERSLSPNSVDAYLRDFDKFVQFLCISNLDLGIKEVEAKHIESFFIFLVRFGYSS